MEELPGTIDGEDGRVVSSGSGSAAAGESPIRSVDKAEFDRLKRLQDETLCSIKGFNAGDRLPREELYRRGRSR